MTGDLQLLEKDALAELEKAGGEDSILAVRTKYLGRKGLLTGMLRNISSVPAEERRVFGMRCNEVKELLEKNIEEALRRKAEDQKAEWLAAQQIDVTLPGRGIRAGRVHPVIQIRNEICGIFAAFGFSVVEGPEVELDYYNFEALNIPKDHPARDMQDTFYIEDNMVLRTHTSPVQVRIMEKAKPPVRILSPGRVYRPDSDVSHTPMFHQIEGLLVDRGVSFGDLKGILTAFLRKVFGEGTILRFRPSFFPFTEPSAEVDIRCVMCGGKGC
ncbi:MAG TPA: phenylalanine--tRNA ligase subunit alpha, partial [Smithellaceae bacterium]|nr:phenylalanine--tRNA ligase subunit alpha [Smithellaceae bacterium]